MNMDYKDDELKRLVTRFWDGESTLEEEKALKDLVAYGNLPEAYDDLAAYFESMGALSDELTLDSSFDDALLEKIDQSEQTNVRSLVKPRFIWAAAAAVVMAFCFVLFKAPNETPNMAASNQETYSKEELQAAFEQTQAALLLISSKMNNATTHADQLNKFHEATVRVKSRK